MLGAISAGRAEAAELDPSLAQLSARFTIEKFWLAAGPAAAALILIVLLVRIWRANRRLRAEMAVHRQREQALRESEGRFRNMFEQNHAVMLVIDPADGTIVDANPAATSYYGWSREELLRRKIAEINTFSPEQIKAELQAARDQRRNHFQFRHRRADGSVREVEVFSGPVTIDGRPLLHSIIHDITERKEAEEKLRVSESNLAITLQSIGDAVIATDAAGRVTRMNPAAERLTGWSFAEASGRALPDVFRIVNAQTRVPSTNPVQLVMERGDVVGLANHTALLARDGREYQISDSAAPIRDPAGKIVGVVLVFSDVTEAYRMREELATNAKMLERTGELAKVGGWELDLRTKVLFWSRETCRIHEIDPLVAPALDRAIDFYAPEARPIIQAAVQAAIERGTPYDLELPLITARGRPIFVRAQCFPVMQDGKTIKLVGAFHDITSRKEVEAALRESNEQFRAFFERSNVGMSMTKASGGTQANQALSDMLGYSPAEFRHATWQSVTHPEDLEATRREIEALVSRKQDSTRFTKRFLHKSGSVVWADLSTTLRRDVEGNPLHMMSTIVDITERVRVEEELKAALREKESLLKEVHHRVKNNLQIISSLLRLEIARGPHPANRAVLADMQGRVRSMALLHESLYRSGVFADLELGSYLRQLATQIYRALVTREGAVQLHLDLAVLRVAMDQALPVALIVNELVSNSLKHGFPAGRTGEVRIELQPIAGGPDVCLRVSDTGVGLPSGFDLAQLQSLGLQLVSDLTRQIGGRLEIGPGPGARFEIRFTPNSPNQARADLPA